MTKDLQELNTKFQKICKIGTVSEIIQYMSKFDNKEDIDGEALMEACFNFNKDVAQYLIDENIGNKNSVLVNCARYNKISMIDFLLSNGADIHAYKNYPLAAAAKEGHVEIIKLLIERGANIFDDEHLAIVWSIENKHEEINSILLNYYDLYQLKDLTQRLKKEIIVHERNKNTYTISQIEKNLQDIYHRINRFTQHAELNEELMINSSSSIIQHKI